MCRPPRASCERKIVLQLSAVCCWISCPHQLSSSAGFFLRRRIFCVSQHFFSAPTLLNCEPSAPHRVSFYSRRLATYPCSFLSAAADLPPVCAYYHRACTYLFRLPSALAPLISRLRTAAACSFRSHLRHSYGHERVPSLLCPYRKKRPGRCHLHYLPALLPQCLLDRVRPVAPLQQVHSQRREYRYPRFCCVHALLCAT